MADAEPQDLILRFYDPKRPGTPTAPASALAQSLDALQRLVFLTAMRREGRTPGRRVRPSAELQERYRLVCGIPTEGSYVSPVRIEPLGLLGPADAAAVMDQVERLLDTVGLGDAPAFSAAVPDETWRGFTLEALERIIPPTSTGVELEVRRHGRSLVDTGAARSFVERLARTRDTRTAVRGSVVGELKRIDFSKQELTIRHSETGRDLGCVYEAHVEENLLGHARDLLLVSGSVTRDAQGRPLSIEGVDHVEPVDLTPIPIESFVHGNHAIEPQEPLSATVTFDETEMLYSAALPTLAVSVFAETREMLAAALEEDVAVLWQHYALAADEQLTKAAQALKRRMLENFRSVPVAS